MQNSHPIYDDFLTNYPGGQTSKIASLFLQLQPNVTGYWQHSSNITESWKQARKRCFYQGKGFYHEHSFIA